MAHWIATNRIKNIDRSARWASPNSPEQIRSALRAYVEAKNGHLETESDSFLTFAFGSRWKFRWMGVSKRGRRELPLKISIRVDNANSREEHHSSTVAAHVSSDLGWYVAIVQKALDLIDEKLDELLRDLKRVTESS